MRETKVCGDCDTEKPWSEYYLNKKTGRPNYSYCKPCHHKRTRDYIARNPEKRRKTVQNWDKRNAERNRTRHRNWRLALYGLTQESFDAMLEAQGGKCANPGCDAIEPGGKGKNWHVDHDHACCPGNGSCGDCVRGLLCSACNQALGLLGDNVVRIQGAAEYLIRWSALRADIGA